MHLKEINANNKFNEYKDKVNYLISNNGSKEDFIKEVDQAINKLEKDCSK